MLGIIDISHRYKHLNAPHFATSLVADGSSEQLQAKRFQSEYSRLLFDHFSSRGYSSIEDYVRATVDSYSKIPNLSGTEFQRVYDTFYLWRTKDNRIDTTNELTRFINARNKIFGEIFLQLGGEFRDVDEENTDLSKFVKTVSKTFAVDDVILWKYNPANDYLVDIGSTTLGKTNADVHRGLISQAIESRRAQYYPNIRRQRDYLELVQHKDTVQSRQWKGMLVCPLHSSKNLVGVLGMYSRHDLIFSKVEIGLILYLLANLSKRVSREVFGASSGGDGGDNLSLEKLMRLAPTIYVGTKTTYRLHSIKNKVRTLGEVLKEIKSHVPAKPQNGINWRDKLAAVQKENREVFEELESCLLIGSNRNKKLFKMIDVHLLVDRIRRMMVNHVSAVDIQRRLTVDYNRNARIHADLISLEQAIYNVIENAFFFLSKDPIERRIPELHVSIVQNEDLLDITVQDNASGMSDEDRDNYRVLYYSGKRKKGSGVGLWMTDRIINDHFGDFDVPSTGYTGTTCSISLPIEEPDDPRKRVSSIGKLLEID